MFPMNYAGKIMYTFTGYGGHLTCRVTGRRKLGKGLEVPCDLVFMSSAAKRHY